MAGAVQLRCWKTLVKYLYLGYGHDAASVATARVTSYW